MEEQKFVYGNLVYINGSNGIYGYGQIEYVNNDLHTDYLVHILDKSTGWTVKDEYNDIPDSIKNKFKSDPDARFLWCGAEELEEIKA